MKSSYRIAIISAVVLLVFIFAYYLKSEKPTTTRNASANGSETRNINTPGGSLVASAENPTPPSMDDLIKKVDALQNASSPVPGQGTPSGAGATAGSTSSSSVSIDKSANPHAPTTDLTGRQTLAGVPATQPSAQSTHDPDGFPRQPSDIFASSDGDHRRAASSSTSGSTLAAESHNTPRVHKVTSGDTFSSIAAKYYGSEKNWRTVAEANPLVDPAKLKVGQVIKVPENHASVEATGQRSVPTEVSSAGATASRKTTPTAGATTASKSSSEYTVQVGDTLSSIARKFYKNGDRWDVIYKANHSAIGSNPENLKMGMKLVIPAK